MNVYLATLSNGVVTEQAVFWKPPTLELISKVDKALFKRFAQVPDMDLTYLRPIELALTRNNKQGFYVQCNVEFAIFHVHLVKVTE